MNVEKIFEESMTKLLILLASQYVEVWNMLYNKKEITILNLPRIQTTTLDFAIDKIAKLEPKIKDINNIKELRQEFKQLKPLLTQLGDDK